MRYVFTSCSQDQRSYIHIKSLDIFELTTNKYWTVDSEGHGWVGISGHNSSFFDKVVKVFGVELGGCCCFVHAQAFIKIQHDMLFSDWVLARPGEIGTWPSSCPAFKHYLGPLLDSQTRPRMHG